MSLTPLITTASNLVKDVLQPAQPPSPAPQSGTPVSPAANPVSSSIAPPSLPTQAPIPVPVQTGVSVVVPFCTWIASVSASQAATESKLLSTLSQVSKIIHNYRDASLLHAELVIFPSANAAKYPVTIQLCWSPGDSVPTKTNIHNYAMFTQTSIGVYTLSRNFLLPIDLNYISPVLKSPIPYVNCPRVTVIYEATDTSAPAQTYSASVYARGKILLSNPLAIPWN